MGAAGAGEVGPCGERAVPTHCRNLQQDVDETDVDCGGARCEACAADEACLNDEDCSTGTCASGTCQRLFELSYAGQNPDLETSSVRLDVAVSYLGSEPLLLRDLTVRYYFSRNSVTEPILPGGSSAQQPSGGDISSDTTWTVVRQLRGNGLTNDAYLEIAFTGGKVLSAGQSLSLNANLTAGGPEAAFNQGTHHSWDTTTTLHETQAISVHLAGRRVWGRGPEINEPLTCFYQGVNLDGPALTVGDDAWLTSPSSVLARYIENNVSLFPKTDGGREQMLRTGFQFQDDSFSYPVENGEYALVVYVWSAGGGETGTLLVGGEQRDRFRAQSFQGGGPWVGLGPYRVEVNDGMLTLGAMGTLRAGGFELRRLDP
jgi:hypothetical protein